MHQQKTRKNSTTLRISRCDEPQQKTGKANAAYYRERQQIIEHQFGTLKEQWHLDHLSTNQRKGAYRDSHKPLRCITLGELCLFLTQ
ncbi:MAG: hypothetical protein R2777_00970 [Chitinophagales bacterium]